MKPGDIVVYRERGQTLGRDRVRRATLQEYASIFRLDKHYYCTEAARRVFVHPSDVIRVEPSQHGWMGA